MGQGAIHLIEAYFGEDEIDGIAISRAQDGWGVRAENWVERWEIWMA